VSRRAGLLLTAYCLLASCYADRGVNALTILLGAVLAAGAAAPRGSSPCPPQGDATKPRLQELNEKKSRDQTPSDEDIDETVTIEALLEPGDDSLRWQDGAAVEMVGYVLEVRDGGATSANCHSSDPAEHDTIFEMSSDADVFDGAHRVFAVVTPGRRRIMSKAGEDWSTRTLRAQYLHRYVAVTGWLLFDFESANRASNTAGGAGPKITRATAWEIHPVTGLELAEEGGAEQVMRRSAAPDASSRGASRRTAR